MRNNVSELMDGELDEADTVKVIAAIKSDNQLFTDWKTYHLIRDSLHQSAVSADFSERVMRQLDNEPIVLAPRARSSGQRRVGFSIAASIALVAAGWLVFQSLEPQQTTLQEVYVSQDVDDKKRYIPSTHPSLVTFQPSSAYMRSSMPVDGFYSIYPSTEGSRGFMYHSNMMHYPHTEAPYSAKISKELQQEPSSEK